MAKPFDASKFRTHITKSIKNISTGFNDPTIWLSTGSFMLNYLISGHFKKGIPVGKVSTFAGESGAGKSYICSGNLVRDAQEQGAFVVLLDSENALDEEWLKALGVDTSESRLMRIGVSMVDDVAKIMNEFIESYATQYGDLPIEERPIVLFVIDSLGMLLTPTDSNQFEQGDMKGDMGRKAKSLTALVRNLINRIAPHNIGVVATNHTYASQDMFDPDDKISGGQGFIYASSIVVAMKKRKLKEDEDGNKTSTVNGIRAACKVMKSRYAKPFEAVELKIPYDRGMDPYSGVFDFFVENQMITKVGNRYRYVTKEGAEILEFRKNWSNDMLDIVMEEFQDMVDTDDVGFEPEEHVEEEVE